MVFYIKYQFHQHQNDITKAILLILHNLFYMPNEVQSYYKNQNQKQDKD